MRTHIVTWFMKMDGLIGNPTSTRDDVYLRNVITFFASSVRNNCLAEHYFITNLEVIPDVDGVDVKKFLKSLSVSTLELAGSHLPPEGFLTTWNSQFYLLDVMTILAHISDDEDAIYVLDSDCVWIDSVTSLNDELIISNGLLAYDTGFSENESINGLTRSQMGDVAKSLDASWSIDIPQSAGGEFIGFSGLFCKSIVDQIPSLWDAMMGQFDRGELHFLTEEHWLSYLYLANGKSIGGANRFVRRIWTSIPPKYRDASQADLDLTVWHLPAEKRYGLTRLFREVIDSQSEFWRVPLGPPFSHYVGSLVGVPARTPTKAILDAKDAVLWKAAQFLRRRTRR